MDGLRCIGGVDGYVPGGLDHAAAATQIGRREGETETAGRGRRVVAGSGTERPRSVFGVVRVGRRGGRTLQCKQWNGNGEQGDGARERAQQQKELRGGSESESKGSGEVVVVQIRNTRQLQGRERRGWR
jgi:hypothetical protein